jgi:hypothetical protein
MRWRRIRSIAAMVSASVPPARCRAKLLPLWALIPVWPEAPRCVRHLIMQQCPN